MTRHKVVLVPFPFDDLSSTKVRPAVCLTDPIGPHKHVVLAFITSRVPVESLLTDFIIADSDSEFGTTGLRVSSAVHLHRMMTVTTGIIVRELGQLTKGMQSKVEVKLKIVFGIT